MAATSNIGGAPVPLYDKDEGLVGMWCPETGRAMLGDAFYVVERHEIPLGMMGDDGWKMAVRLDGTD